jgi:hypothetical protein
MILVGNNLRKLVIVSGSIRVLKTPTQPIPAIERINGVFVGQIRKYYNHFRNTDVLILSPIYGLVAAKEKIAFKEPSGTKWYDFDVSPDEEKRNREANLKILQNLLSKNQYNEIYLNVGKNMLRLIPKIEEIVPKSTSVVYSMGAGIGPKMAHMKKWIMSTISSDVCP